MKFNEYVKMLLESTLVEDAGSSLEKLQTKYSGVKKIIKIMRGNGGNGLKDVTKKELSKAFSELNKELLGGKQFNWDRQEIANDIYSEAKRSFDKPSYEFIETLCDTIYSDKY